MTTKPAMTKLYVDLTPEQIAQMKPLFEQTIALLKQGTCGALLAQVDERGFMKIVLVDEQKASAIQEITGVDAEVVAHNRRQLDIIRRQLQQITTSRGQPVIFNQQSSIKSGGTHE